jgi:hypothetical protein
MDPLDLLNPSLALHFRTFQYYGISILVLLSQQTTYAFVYGSFQMFPFRQNSPLVQKYTSASDRKDFGNIPGSHFLKAFSEVPSHCE